MTLTVLGHVFVARKGHMIGCVRCILGLFVGGIRLKTNAETYLGVCCDENTTFIETKYEKHNIQQMWDEAKDNLDTYINEPIKGVKGMISSELIPENLTKGFIRYKNNLSVFRDGTTRFDMVDISMTHFKPIEIGLSLEKAQELGYEVTSVEDVVELKIQDVVLSLQLAEQLLDTTRYIDEMLIFS